MKRPGYREAIYWLAHNDDVEWLRDSKQRGDELFASVTSCLVADLFGVTVERVAEDVWRELNKEHERKARWIELNSKE